MKPSGYTIKAHPQTESVQTGQAAIMDDTTYIMDDPRVFMGGQVTIFPNIRAKAVTPQIHTSVRKRR